MAHLFLQQDPKVSVGDASDVSTSIPTPEQLGSFLFTHLNGGSSGKIYCAVLVAGVPTWVPIGGATPAVIKFFSGALTGSGGIVDGFIADTGNLTMPVDENEYPAGTNGFTASFLTVRCPAGQNKMTTAVVVTLLKNGAPTGITLSVPALTTGQFVSTPVTPVAYVPGDYFDVLVESNAGGANTIRMSVALT